MTEKENKAQNTQDQERGVGSPQRQKQGNKKDKTSSRKELSDTKPSKQ